MMKPLVNSRQMYQIDNFSVEKGYSTNRELMENAGKAVVDSIASRYQGLNGLVVGIACGKGKNGGDGLVVARLLARNGASVKVLLTCDAQQMDCQTQDQLGLIAKTDVKIESWFDVDSGLISTFKGVDVVVDGLLGIGQNGPPKDPIKSIIELINATGKPIFAIDIPSGVVADTGSVPGQCVKASVTVSFGLSKIGHLFYPGRNFCGNLEIADIGLSSLAFETVSTSIFLPEVADIRANLPYRKGNAHKGNCGSVAVIAGSIGMSGAAALTSEAVLRAGAGTVVLGVPKSLNDIAENSVIEVMTQSLPEVRRTRCLSLRALGMIEQMLTRADVLALGPGLGLHHETAELVRRLVKRCSKPLVLDADGLNACVGNLDLFSQRVGSTILTPHIGEFSRLIGLSVEAVVSDVVNLARTFSKEHQVVLLLKGAPSIVALPIGKVFVNPTGNAGMATAGSGDVLTGLVAGLVAQGVSVEDAPILGAYLHGDAGDRARDRLGEWGLLARDILGEIPHAFVGCHRLSQ